jgi:transitional endoplasmic reticulum ATPase
MENNHKEILFNNINDFIVEEGKGPSTDNSVVQITQKKMDELKLFKSETVLVKGRKRKKLVLILLPDDSGSLPDNKVRLNEIARRNLGVNIGDLVNINKTGVISVLERVKILPIKDTIEGISGNLTQTYLIPYFREAYRPVTKGEIIRCEGTFKKVEF